MDESQSSELLIRIDERTATLVELMSDIEVRVRSLERDRWRLAGVVTILAVVGSSVVSPVVALLVRTLSEG